MPKENLLFRDYIDECKKQKKCTNNIVITGHNKNYNMYTYIEI